MAAAHRAYISEGEKEEGLRALSAPSRGIGTSPEDRDGTIQLNFEEVRFYLCPHTKDLRIRDPSLALITIGAFASDEKTPVRIAGVLP